MALTGGEAFEGLNNAGISSSANLIVIILNDNENVYFTKCRCYQSICHSIRIDENSKRAKKDI